MSITVVSKEARICDFCKKVETYTWNACLRCGKDICHACRDTVAKHYEHSVYASGSGDGAYCNECDAILRKAGTDEKHNAYLAIKALRDESKSWSDNFERRRKEAEERLTALQ